MPKPRAKLLHLAPFAPFCKNLFLFKFRDQNSSQKVAKDTKEEESNR